MPIPRHMRECHTCGHLASAHKSGRGRCGQPIETGKPEVDICTCTKLKADKVKR